MPVLCEGKRGSASPPPLSSLSVVHFRFNERAFEGGTRADNETLFSFLASAEPPRLVRDPTIRGAQGRRFLSNFKGKARE